VGRLLAAQFPQWADLSIKPVHSAGTDSALYRLGDDMVVRLPRIHWAVDQIDKERQWLPRLAPHLPLAIPVQLAKGKPGEGYPWHWSVYRWLEGEKQCRKLPCKHRNGTARLVGTRRFIAQSFCGWPFAREGGPVKTEEAPPDLQSWSYFDEVTQSL
jgi:aminoglycoside phosphotransferase (APT) family kinase protein